MNKQGERGIEWTHIYGPGTGRTWNVIGGCAHGCEWVMPDGSVAECYAKSVAEGLASSSYPGGFAVHQFHPERLEEPLRVAEPCGIFLDSMSDLLGRQVTDAQVRAVLDVARQADWHTFFLLTKNAPRLLTFADYLPRNVWAGVSMPPSVMFGKRLSLNQQRAYLTRAWEVLDELRSYDVVRWMSFEPLSFDVAPQLDTWFACYNSLPTDWAVIGAASNGKRTYQPEPGWVSRLLAVLDRFGRPVFFKGNLDWSPRREEWPGVLAEPVEVVEQMRLEL